MEEVKDGTLLEPTGLSDGQDTFDKQATMVGLGTIVGVTPEEAAKSSLASPLA